MCRANSESMTVKTVLQLVGTTHTHTYTLMASKGMCRANSVSMMVKTVLQLVGITHTLLLFQKQCVGQKPLSMMGGHKLRHSFCTCTSTHTRIHMRTHTHPRSHTCTPCRTHRQHAGPPLNGRRFWRWPCAV